MLICRLGPKSASPPATAVLFSPLAALLMASIFLGEKDQVSFFTPFYRISTHLVDVVQQFVAVTLLITQNSVV
jgi:hypothetical protein